jgi:hypothetical protein
MMVGFFSPERVEPLLKYTDEYNMGLSRRAVSELLSRGEGGKIAQFFARRNGAAVAQRFVLAQWLAIGRRYGSSVPPDSENPYFVFDVTEVPEVLREVNMLLSVDTPWKTEEFKQSIEVELVRALQRAALSNLYLAGRYT